MAETLICTGFFLVYFIEELAQSTCKMKARPKLLSAIDNSGDIPTFDLGDIGLSIDHPAALDPAEKTASNVRDVLTILALSLHDVFEGLSVGLQQTVSDVWTLYAGILHHMDGFSSMVFGH